MSSKDSEVHKFDSDSGMTSQEVFDFAFKTFLIPILESIGDELGRDDFVEVVQAAASKHGGRVGRQDAVSVPRNDLATFVAWIDDPNHIYQRFLTYDVVERTASVCEIRVTECLWARTCREAGAADVGYAVFCHPDFAATTGFNPAIQTLRTKCLMQGDDCCNHRWVTEE